MYAGTAFFRELILPDTGSEQSVSRKCRYSIFVILPKTLTVFMKMANQKHFTVLSHITGGLGEGIYVYYIKGSVKAFQRSNR
jgi:hypothetical protein